jgi:hypothetical protein
VNDKPPFDYGTKLPDGQYQRHPELPPQARQRFVRPVRTRYRHVGMRPRFNTRPLSEQEERDHAGMGYLAFEPYPPGHSPAGALGRFWTLAQLNSGCGTVTTMPDSIAETYAAKPDYYGTTFCVQCGAYFRVGADGEFVWKEPDGQDGPKVGT